MKKLKYLLNIIYHYRKVFFQVIFFEIFFSFKLNNILSNIKIQDNKYRTDTVPCVFYFLYLIKVFIKKNKIKSIVDVGSGYGRVVSFLTLDNKIKSYGIEYDKKVFNVSLRIKNKRIKLFCGNIFSFNLKKFKSNCFILIDPFKKIRDRNRFFDKIKKEVKSKKKFVITVNVSQKKIPKYLKLIYSKDASKERYLKIYKFIQ